MMEFMKVITGKVFQVLVLLAVAIVFMVFVVSAQLVPQICENAFIRGDANSDSEIEISDVVYLLNFLFDDSEENVLQCLDVGDVNDDESTDVSDAVYLLSYLFSNGPEPPGPFPDLGYDEEGWGGTLCDGIDNDSDLTIDEGENCIVYTWEDVLDIPNVYSDIHSFVENPDGSVIVGGWFYNISDTDFLLRKYSQEGEEIWTEIFPGMGSDKLTSMSILDDGSVYSLGSSNSYSAGGDIDFYLVETDQDGNYLGYNVYGSLTDEYISGSRALARVVNGGGNHDGFIMVASTTDGPALLNLKVVKTYVNGAEEWSGIYGPNGSTYSAGSWGIKQLSDLGYIIFGVAGVGSGNTGFLIKLDENGNVEWEKYDYEGLGFYIIRDVVEMPSGNILTFGYSKESGFTWDEYVIEVDMADGGEINNWSYEKSLLTSAARVGDGYVFSSRDLNPSQGGLDFKLTKIDDNGNFLWNKFYPLTQSPHYPLMTDDKPFQIDEASDGGIIIGGIAQIDFQTNPPEMGDQGYIVKINSNGEMD